ncbi:MAG: hypothetical protein JWL69_2728 [Phycisphaerales bacterium]|nr:hypothetical protein [Phycisphaerales bacterium]
MRSRGSHHFVIDPLKGVGPIRFGMHKEEVSHAFTYVYRSFFKTRESKVRADHCEVVGLIVHYDSDSRVSYIEVTKPVYGTVTVELFGTDITGISIRRLADLLRSNSAGIERCDYGYECPTLGLNIFNSHATSEHDPVECLGVRCGSPASA